MGKIYNGSIPIEQVFKFNQNAPLDDRVSVQYYSDLTGIKAYPGLMVYVSSEDKYYYYNKDGEWAVSTSAGGGDGLIDGTVLGTINGKEFAYKRSISLSSSDIGLDNQKIHIGHSNDGGQTLSNSGEWIGFYVGGETPSSNPNDYAPWQKLSEGVGIEKMDDYFKIGTAASPQKPTVNNQGVVSGDWSPEPLEPTSQYQYLWAVVVTKFTNNTYSVSNPHIAGIKGSSALTGDLDNEMDSIPLNYQGYTTKQETKSTRMTIFFGSTPQTLTQLIATSSQVDGITLITDKDTGTVAVTVTPDTLVEENIVISITGTTLIGEITKTFTLSAVRASKDGDNAIIYQLQPSDNAIKVNSSLVYSTIYLTITVNKIDGDVITAVNPNSDGHFLFYKVDDGSWTKYGSQISVGSAKKQVKLRLISVDTTNENFTGITYDRETIPVVIDGQNGTSITIKGKVQDSNHLPDPLEYQDGDAIITENDGHIWVMVDGQWVDCGQFQGLPGVSSYVHIKYSSDGTRFTTNNGEDEGPWIGIYVDTNPEDSSIFTDYRWQKISGDDGSSQEFVFIRVDEWDGSEAGKPVLTQSSGNDFQNDDYLPSNWTNPESHKVYQWEDDPMEATEDHPFIFYSQRKKISGIWQPFGNVLLWNRFTKDGDTTVLYQLVLNRDIIRPEDESKIINIKIVRSQGEYSENITTEDNFQLKYSIDGGSLLTSTGISNAAAGVNINIAAAEDYVNFYLYSDTNLLAQKSCNIITGAIGIQSVAEWYKVTETNEPPSKDDEDWSNTITQVTSYFPYLWNYEVCYSTQGGVLSETEITLIAVYSENGRGIVEIQEYYQISDQSISPPIRWTGDTTPTARVSDDIEKTILNTWKANADLTTHEKPYLWNFAVVQYSKTPLFEYEVPQCIGVQGSSPLIMDLDNEMDSFIVNEDNKYEGENLQLETGVNVYLGKDSQSLTALTATPQSGSGVSSSDIVSDRTNKKVTVTIKKNQVYSKKIEITITATTSSGILSKVFTIVPVPGGESAVIYKITPAYDVIKVDKNGNRVPATTITSQITKITGKSSSETANSFSGVTLKYSIDGGNYNNYNSSSPPSSTSINQNIKFRLLDNNSTVLDQETIPVVYDGVDGSNVLIADLDNEMAGFALDSNGYSSSEVTLSAETTLSVFEGSESVTITNCTVTNPMSGLCTITKTPLDNSKKYKIRIELTQDEDYNEFLNSPVNFIITGTGEGWSASRIFSVCFYKSGESAKFYQLQTSSSTIKKTISGEFEEPLTVSAIKIEGKQFSAVTTGVHCYYSLDNSSTWTKLTLSTSSPTNLLDNNNPQYNIRFRLQNVENNSDYGSNGFIQGVKIYDKETIPVVVDGKNAKQYSLVASRKDFNRDDPVTVYSYVSDGESEALFAGYFVVVEKDFDGQILSTEKSSSQSSSKEWSPNGDDVYKIQFYIFKSRAESTNFNPNTSIPLAQCELLAQQSTAELDLGGLDGTQNYVVSSENKITETQVFIINCKFYINSLENSCNITVTPKETYTVGMLYDTTNSSGTHLQFIANPSNTAVNDPQIYTVKATATYCGITYTRQKEVIFTPVAAGASIQGANGCIVRYRGNWGDITGWPNAESPARVVLFNCESSHTDAGTFETSPRFKYIDVVRYSGKYYRCNTRHKITINAQFISNLQTPKYIPGQNYQGQSYWTEASEFDFIVTDTLIAEFVSSQTISAKDVIITERNANNEVTSIVGGMTSSSASVGGNNLNLGSVRIWAGTTTLDPDIQNAPFRVTQGGQLTATNANINGNITATDFRLVSGNEVVLHLSTFGALKTQFQNTNLSEQSYDDTLPLFAVRDQNEEWYFLPLTKIVPNVPSGSTSVLNEVKGFLLNSSLTANKLVSSGASSIDSTDSICKLCSSTDSSLNKKYYKLSATSPTTVNLYTGSFVGNGLPKKETITINRGGYTADITIRTRSVLIITNGVATIRYVYVGPKVTWSSSGYTVDWNTRWFWKPFSAKSDGYHPDFSTEVSATYSEDFLGYYISIVANNNHDPGPLDV